jgi:hypothetical protein
VIPLFARQSILAVTRVTRDIDFSVTQLTVAIAIQTGVDAHTAGGTWCTTGLITRANQGVVS